MISIRNLNKTHHNRGQNKVKALTNINIDFDETGITFIAGGSGNGKSTLLSLIGGIDKYSHGQILVDGKDLKLLSKKELDAYRNSYLDFIIQENTLISSLTVGENVRLEKSISGEYASDEDVEAALEVVGLKGYADRMPAEISGGEKKRVAIARTLLMDVKVILVDEPTASLDKTNTKIIWDVLKKYAETHLIIAVSHKEEVIKEYADRVITLEAGKIVSDERPRQKPKQKALKTKTSLNKSKLGAKQSVKLAYSYLSSRKASFSFVTVLSCLALLFFGVFFILNGYNYNKVLAYSTTEEDAPYVAFVNGTLENSSVISKEESEAIIEMLRNNNLTITNSFKDMAQVNFAVDFGNGFYTSSSQNFTIKGLIEVEGSVGSYNSIGQKVLAGTYPTNATPDQVVISDYFAELLVRYGAEVFDGTNTVFMAPEALAGTEEEPYKNLIGKSIQTNYGPIKVGGVFETDYKRFVYSEDLSFRGYNREEFAYKLNFIYSVIHTSNDFIDAYALAHPTATNLIATIEKDSINQITETGLQVSTMSELAPSSYYVVEGTNIATLEGNQIIISAHLYNTMISSLAGYKTLTSADLVDGEVDFEVVPSNNANLGLTITLNGGQSKTYTIVGVHGSVDDDTVDNIVYLTNVAYTNDILSQTTFSATTKVLYTRTGNQTIEKVINLLEGSGINYVSINSEAINSYGEKIGTMSQAFLIASIFMAIYTLVLMYYFISQIIIDKKSDIGILKTLGCGTKDIVSIFVLCGIAVVFIVFLLTVLLTFVVAALANVIIVSQIPVTISVFSTSGLMYLWISLICISVVALGTLIPIWKYSKLPPKELLKIF